jgi:hypothetical protein
MNEISNTANSEKDGYVMSAHGFNEAIQTNEGGEACPPIQDPRPSPPPC